MRAARAMLSSASEGDLRREPQAAARDRLATAGDRATLARPSNVAARSASRSHHADEHFGVTKVARDLDARDRDEAGDPRILHVFGEERCDFLADGFRHAVRAAMLGGHDRVRSTRSIRACARLPRCDSTR